MADDERPGYSPIGFITIEIGVGVWWYVWGLYGFWWGALYGIGWEVWVGYRLASYLLGAK